MARHTNISYYYTVYYEAAIYPLRNSSQSERLYAHFHYSVKDNKYYYVGI